MHDPEVRTAILDIAALSSEHYPLPDAMLPLTTDWPVSQKIEDIRRAVPGLGLVRISREGDRYWALAHSVIGRYLITALYWILRGVRRQASRTPRTQSICVFCYYAGYPVCRPLAIPRIERSARSLLYRSSKLTRVRVTQISCRFGVRCWKRWIRCQKRCMRRVDPFVIIRPCPDIAYPGRESCFL